MEYSYIKALDPYGATVHMSVCQETVIPLGTA